MTDTIDGLSTLIDYIHIGLRGNVDRSEGNSFPLLTIPLTPETRNMKTFTIILSILLAAVPTVARPNMRSLYRVDVGEEAAGEQLFRE